MVCPCFSGLFGFVFGGDCADDVCAEVFGELHMSSSRLCETAGIVDL